MILRPPGRAILALMGLVALACSCAGPARSSGGCDAVERISSSQSFHVIDPADAEYEQHPPAAGVHTSYVPAGGVHDLPVAEAEQVAALESGMVVVNYDDDALDDADLGAVRRLADFDGVLVTAAAATIDDGAPLAFTAWGKRQLCESFDIAEARAFVREHVNEHASEH